MSEEFTLKDIYSELEVEESEPLKFSKWVHTSTKEIKFDVVIRKVWRIDPLSKGFLKEDWDTESLIEVIEGLVQRTNKEENDE